MADRKSTRNDWTSVKEVAKQLDHSADMVARVARDEYLRSMRGMVNGPHDAQAESPLEAIFWVWWHAYMYNAHEGSPHSYLYLECQREVIASGQNYRLDFVVRLRDEADERRFEEAGRPFPLIAVEVDGHGFHEKTPEQVALRNTRDRALQLDGWLVFHFSWSEMTTSGEARVGEVVDVAIAASIECQRAAARKWADEHPDAVAAIISAIKKDGD